MADRVSAGVIMRRGMGGLSPSEYKYLLDNADKVDAILERINEIRDMAKAAEQAAAARVTEAEAAEEKLAEHEAALVKERADLETATADAANQHQHDMDALGRRTREVMDKETASTERATALDAREQEIEDHGRDRESEFQEREQALESQQTAADERDQGLHEQASDLNERQTRLETAAKMVRQAAASLG